MMFLLLACQAPEPSEGTIVGNPGQLMPLMANSDGVELTFASGYLDSVVYVPQGVEEWDDNVIVSEFDLYFDLIEDKPQLEIEMGAWSSIELYFDDLFIAGFVGEERSFVLDVGELYINLQAAQQIDIQQSIYLLELGQPNWIDGEEILSIDDFEEEELEIGQEDEELYSTLLEQLDFETTLFQDADGDGVVDEAEREKPLAVADEEQVSQTVSSESNEDSDTDAVEPVMVDSQGCQESQLSLAWFPFLLGLLMIRRQNEVR